jgi:hypothetical protein
VVGVVTSYGPDGSGLNPGRSQRCACQLWGLTSLLFDGYRGSFLGLQWPGGEVNPTPPSSAKVKHEWSYTSSPPMCLYGVDRENFTFLH